MTDSNKITIQNIEKSPEQHLRIADLTIAEKEKITNLFAWLIQEDKKQNPKNYERRKQN